MRARIGLQLGLMA